MPDTVIDTPIQSGSRRRIGPRALAERWFQSAVLRLLEGFDKGFLDLMLPSGGRRTFGSPDATLKASIRVIRPAFFRKCILYGDIGFGEAYVAGDWETDNITDVIAWMILNLNQNPAVSGSSRHASVLNLLRWANKAWHMVRPNSLRGSRQNIAHHYDLSNDFFQLLLDPSMTYSCAYFDDSVQELQRAQQEKYDRLCKKLDIRATDHVLEIGGGWGGFAEYAAKTYGCRITTVTISPAQFEFAKARIAREKLTERVEVQLMDYRQIRGEYDKIVSIEMLEAVGHRYLPRYFRACHDLLKKEGRLALQVIICPDSRYDLFRKGVDWIQKHIFPGSLLPSIAAINHSVNKTGDLFLHGLEDIGLYYPPTLKRWRENLNRNADRIKQMGFDEQFMRKWNYYFCYCEAAFATRHISTVQMVYARPNNRAL